MKSPQPRSRWKIVLAPLTLAFLLLAGCYEQSLTWSPDGKRGAMIGNSGLFLCDANGTLSPLLVPGATRVAWLSDSQRLVLAKKYEVDTWAPIARVLGPKATAEKVAQAEEMWKKVQSGASWEEVAKSRDAKLMKVYLRERYGEAVQAKLAAYEKNRWPQSDDVAISQLIVARIEGDKIVLGAQLYEGLDSIMNCRIAPGDQAVAFVTNRGPDGRLWISAMDATAPLLAAERVAYFPDWTTDGRSLVYLQASGAALNDDLRLGTLVQREVRNADGKIRLQAEQKYLAGWIFSEMSRARCLRDGRILFNAAEISLPISAKDYGEQREQLFAIDPARQATLVRLIPRSAEGKTPSWLSFFEVSPDERQVVVGDLHGHVALLTLATGEAEEIQASDAATISCFPVWRGDGEISYTRRMEANDGKDPVRPVEIVLRKGETQKTLSTSWPDELLNELYTAKQK